MKKFVLSCTAALVAMGISGSANAATITFDSFGIGSGATFGTFSEAGFDVSMGGFFYDASQGEVEPLCCGSTGLMTVTKTGGGGFSFGSIDKQLEYGSLASFTVKGFLGATLLFTQIGSTTSDLYDTFLSTSGASVDKLEFTGDRDSTGGISLDNLVLGSGAVPEPSTWAMMLAGFGAVGFAMRRRRNVTVSFA